MEKLYSGNFFGITDLKIESEDIILTNTAYTHDYVDWHHHENAYFTFICSGQLIEGTKKGKKYCSPGSLLFHHAEEAHYNIKPKGHTRGMHIELPKNILIDNGSWKHTNGSFEINNVDIKILFYNILKESYQPDDLTATAIHELVAAVMDRLFQIPQTTSPNIPSWVKIVAELLQEHYQIPLNLKEIASQIGIHSVHLSRSFPKYFHCTIAQYIRKIRVQRALEQLSRNKFSLSDIAYQCGFADQSHMVRCFKEFSGTTPHLFRKIIQH